MSFLQNIFGSKNEREIKKIQPLVARVNELEPTLKAKDDVQLARMTVEFRERLANGAPLDSILPEAFATVREAGRRVLNMRHYDVQLIGGTVLHKGSIAEMKTGEGKTLVATLPLYLNALGGKGAHLVTVNDYLARRDAEWMGRLYKFLGMSTGVIVHGLGDFERQDAYRCDITYGQNNEFGFDYLRDNMKMSPDRMVQRELNYAVVDEVDSILIDEARTPLIISGPAEQSADLYQQVNAIVPRLKKDLDFTVDEKAHSAMLTDQGVERVEKLLGIDNLYDPKNLIYNHHVTQALRGHTLYKRDVQYVIENGKVVIIDEHTGRKMPGRRWSDGLHQAIEAKENVRIEEENQTLATISFQNYFRLYGKLSGMTGTADTEAAEFHKIYKLDVIVIPTNKGIQRKDEGDLIYKNEKGKFGAVLQDILDRHERGQPILVGTTSVEKSEVVSKFLRSKGIHHELLNAKQHEREAHVVAQAGRKGAITISTNMAGRGTDILLGGNPEELAKADADPKVDPAAYEAALARYREQCAAEKAEVLAAGGLHILGTERHESRRIDNQLRGRAGRQGDPGSSRFYLSLEDDLLRIFGGDKLLVWMERLGMEEDVPIEAKMVTRSIENAQKRVEGHNFDIRKHLLEYDDVMNQQRKTIYALRRQILEGRYVPELSEEDKKAGKEAPVPTVSGDWTLESVAAAERPKIAAFIDKFFEEPAPAPPPEELVSDDGEEGEEAPPPAPRAPTKTWRDLRGQIWRQYGTLVNEVATLFDGPRAALVDKVTERIAASLIQQRERIYDLTDRLIAEQIEAACPPTQSPDDWDIEALQKQLSEMVNMPVEVPRGQDPQEMATTIWKQVEAKLLDREKSLTPTFLLYFARHFWLEEIDQQWIEHLKSMDHLREGIGLRSYGQRDPKQEYKKEGFRFFGEMMVAIERNVGSKLFRVQLVKKEEELPVFKHKERKMVAVHPGDQGGTGVDAGQPGAAGAGGAGAEAEGGDAPRKPVTVRREAPKIGRNDPCHCGSGKKYKKCHGAGDTASA